MFNRKDNGNKSVKGAGLFLTNDINLKKAAGIQMLILEEIAL